MLGIVLSQYQSFKTTASPTPVDDSYIQVIVQQGKHGLIMKTLFNFCRYNLLNPPYILHTALLKEQYYTYKPCLALGETLPGLFYNF